MFHKKWQICIKDSFVFYKKCLFFIKDKPIIDTKAGFSLQDGAPYDTHSLTTLGRTGNKTDFEKID
ncbi:MAG: hypothetical protein VB088_08575 [Sphaerochaeta sp.]|uniref:hypothetical protein n=1 Tax=uncultured Sphaerochaeta sp. TaxID=886478 RepID=UPI0026389B00|nr:hypothetical protein [uncultured Sphaerochaeta sp.]MEA4865436.1 hypothetical protein [Sphaerochaeta sp.]